MTFNYYIYMILFSTNHTILIINMLYTMQVIGWWREHFCLPFIICLSCLVSSSKWSKVVQIIFIQKLLLLKAFFQSFQSWCVAQNFFSQTQPKILILTSTILPWCDQHLMMILWVLFFYSLVLASKLFLHYVINTNNAEFLVFWPLTHCGQKIFYFYSRFSTW